MSYLAFAREMLGNLFKPPATVEYPLKPKTFPEINRGKVVNSIDDCIFCGMCMRVCPSAAITVDRGARTWSINRFACVQCRGCVDHCPKNVCVWTCSIRNRPGKKPVKFCRVNLCRRLRPGKRSRGMDPVPPLLLLPGLPVPERR